MIALFGLWEFGDIAALVTPGFGKIQPYLWNHIIVGFIFIIAGARAALTRDAGIAISMDRIAAVAGIWLVVATFILRSPAKNIGLLNDVIVGAIVFILSVLAMIAGQQASV